MKKIFLGVILVVALNVSVALELDDKNYTCVFDCNETTNEILELDENTIKSLKKGATYKYNKNSMIIDLESVISGESTNNKIDYNAIKVELHDKHKRDFELIDKGNFVEIRAKSKAKIKVKDSSGKIKQIQ